MRRSLRDLRYWAPVILWMSFIFWMSTGSFSSEDTSRIIEPLLRFLVPTISGQAVDAVHSVLRKLGHVSEYLVLGLLLFRAFGRVPAERHVVHRAFYSLTVVVLYALSDEFHQSFVSSRTASPVDVCIDAFGGFLAQVAALLWYRRRAGGKACMHPE